MTTMEIRDLRQWQHDARVNDRIRRLVGDAADEIERLREALKPFVIAANNASGFHDNCRIGICDTCMSLEGLTVGDLRRARGTHGT